MNISTFSIIALLMSIFNVVNTLSANSNNRNNRNNINNNADNVNVADNSESNANANQEVVAQVMLVPPGAGRRRRKRFAQRALTGKVSNGTLQFIGEWASSGIPIATSDEWTSFLDEVSIGLFLFYNTWNLGLSTESFLCQRRNFCELGLNARVTGPGAEMVTQVAAADAASWLAKTPSEANFYLNSLEEGLQWQDCAYIYKECDIDQWNRFVHKMRNETITKSKIFLQTCF